jgi:hypothetical protein
MSTSIHNGRVDFANMTDGPTVNGTGGFPALHALHISEYCGT